MIPQQQDANARLIPRAIRICGHPGGPRLQLCYARLRETGISGREGRGRHMRANTHTHTHLTHRHRYTRTERAGKMEQEARGKRQKVHRLVGAADAVRRRRQDAVPGLCYGGEWEVGMADRGGGGGGGVRVFPFSLLLSCQKGLRVYEFMASFFSRPPSLWFLGSCGGLRGGPGVWLPLPQGHVGWDFVPTGLGCYGC